MTFEQAMTRLQEIVKRLETPNLSLDESLKLFEEGLQLSKFCQDQLTNFSEKVDNLVQEYQEQGGNNEGTIE